MSVSDCAEGKRVTEGATQPLAGSRLDSYIEQESEGWLMLSTGVKELVDGADEML